MVRVMNEYESGVELLNWFAGRAGDHIPNEYYQVLFPEFANLITGTSLFKTVDDVVHYIQREKAFYE